MILTNKKVQNPHLNQKEETHQWHLILRGNKISDSCRTRHGGISTKMEHLTVHQRISIVRNACWLLPDGSVDVLLFPLKVEIVAFFQRVVECICIVTRYKTIAEMRS